MFARVATFEGGDRQRRRELNEQRMKDGTLDPPEGIKSVLLLEDAENDRSLFLTFFESREAIAAAEARFAQMGEEIPEDVRGRRVALDVYEVAFSLDASDAAVGS